MAVLDGPDKGGLDKMARGARYNQDVDRPSPEPVSILALDIGRRRIGLAFCGAERMAVEGLETLHRTNVAADVERLSALAARKRVGLFVAGLPRNMDGSEGAQAAFVRTFRAELETRSGVRVHLQDERLTSVEAEERLRLRGWSLKRLLEEKKRGAVDRLAAILILEDYLAAEQAAAREPDR